MASYMLCWDQRRVVLSLAACAASVFCNGAHERVEIEVAFPNHAEWSSVSSLYVRQVCGRERSLSTPAEVHRESIEAMLSLVIRERFAELPEVYLGPGAPGDVNEIVLVSPCSSYSVRMQTARFDHTVEWCTETTDAPPLLGDLVQAIERELLSNASVRRIAQAESQCLYY